MAERQISVVRAFNSYAGDGSGGERYFTAGNAHELEGFVSAEELQYRIDNGYVTVSEPVELPERVFSVPENIDPVVTADTPARRVTSSRKGRGRADVSEG